MKYNKKYSFLVAMLTLSSVLTFGFNSSKAETLNRETVRNYISMGMSPEQITQIQKEMSEQDDPNYITPTERDFYINNMGIKPEDMDKMIADEKSDFESINNNEPSMAPLVHGTYPTEKGIILVTKDKLGGIVPLGHAAIVYSSSEVIESDGANGVHTGKNNWASTRSTVYGLKVHKLTQAQRAEVATWCGRKRTLPYNWNFYDVNTRSKFYCSQLVWAGFKDIYNIDLNGGQYGQAIYPPEMIDSGYVYRIYIKGDGY